ncbi:hypothetical protein [Robertmurraya massiliosenegalensis]|nr:hypothetical protein [Robertmurraya massiliosenegalensis]
MSVKGILSKISMPFDHETRVWWTKEESMSHEGFMMHKLGGLK